MESKGWVVAKWMNNVEFALNETNKDNENIPASLIPAKRKYNPFTKFASFGNGFPDFIAYKIEENKRSYEVIGVEVKSNGYLDRNEKLRCSWLIKNEIFGKITIAKKGKKRGEIVYTDFEN